MNDSPATPAVLSHLSQDPVMSGIIQRGKPLHSSRSEDLYFKLLGSIVSQQLSTKAAATIFRRFTELFPDNYPHPDLLQDILDVNLRGAGLSFQKIGYVRNVAAYAAEGNLTYSTIAALPDEELILHLTKIKGVGRWTVEMLLMFALERPDILPLDDLGIQNAIKRHYNLNEKGKTLKASMVVIAENWRPYRTVACRYLWQSLDNEPK